MVRDQGAIVQADHTIDQRQTVKFAFFVVILDEGDADWAIAFQVEHDVYLLVDGEGDRLLADFVGVAGVLDDGEVFNLLEELPLVEHEVALVYHRLSALIFS